jgi:hypothetical protein
MNPVLNPEIANRQRKVVGSVVTRNVRLDAECDEALATIQTILKGDGLDPLDVVSVSLAIRRSIRLYLEYLDRLAASNPTELAKEQDRVRKKSRFSGLNSRRNRHKARLAVESRMIH